MQLVQPADEFQDTYVLAFRKIESEENILTNRNASVTSHPAVKGAHQWLDHNPATGALFTIGEDAPYTVDIKASEPFVARSLLLTPANPVFKCDVKVQAKIDGVYQFVK